MTESPTAESADHSKAHLDSPGIHRIEVRPALDEPDPLAAAAWDQASAELPGVRGVSAARVYLLESPLTDEQVHRIAHQLLADPVSELAVMGVEPAEDHTSTVEVHYLPGVMDPVAYSTRDAIAEMFPDIEPERIEVRTGVRYDLVWAGATGPTDEALQGFAGRHLANPVIQAIVLEPYVPASFPHAGRAEVRVDHVPIRDLDDEALGRLSREAHLFLSLEEMRAIQAYYQTSAGDGEGEDGADGRHCGGGEPTEIELETLAQTWSEHCVHKTLKAKVRYVEDQANTASEEPTIHWAGRPGHTVQPDGSVTIDNLLRSTVAAATFQLRDEDPVIGDWLVSVFDDNAGIVKLDDEYGIAIKVETHNHPSAIEPYGGASTGIGGCIRDILGTGLAAKPIANTDVFAVAWGGGEGPRGQGAERPREENQESDDAQHSAPWPLGPSAPSLPSGVIHPRRILERVVAGVRDYGNRMGIPTVNGAVTFHDDYLGNPLVFAGCLGLIPLDRCFGQPQPGDRIVALGGRTGRDGIHGATFSSSQLTDTHADEFSHAVQIGNAITQKKMLDVILQARDYPNTKAHAGRGRGSTRCLFSAITDCGAGGFSSAVGEMGEHVGALVNLEQAPLKYQGLTPTEIWISEAQERMVLAVPPDNLETLGGLCEAEDVEICDLGEFGCEASSESDQGGEAQPMLVLRYDGLEMGRLSMGFLHDGLPMPVRDARWGSGSNVWHRHPKRRSDQNTAGPSLDSKLLALLSHPNIASKHWIIRQYDHEVQGGSVVKPLVGPHQDGPSDAAVVRPILESNRGVAISCGLAPQLSEKATSEGLASDGDSYVAALAAIDEAVRNAVCVGADPRRIALLDNFCWPSCDDPEQLGALVRAAEACYDGALAYRSPFVSGKDSLSNQFTTDAGQLITVPQTLLITALGICEHLERCVTMDAKQPGNALLIVGHTSPRMGGSHLGSLEYQNNRPDHRIPRVDLDLGPRQAAAVAGLIQQGLVRSAHDCSDGGLLVAAAEMAFAGRVGLDLDLTSLPSDEDALPLEAACFAETPSRYLLEVQPDQHAAACEQLAHAGICFAQIGTFADHDRLRLGPESPIDAALNDLRETWRSPLDWT